MLSDILSYSVFKYIEFHTETKFVYHLKCQIYALYTQGHIKKDSAA